MDSSICVDQFLNCLVRSVGRVSEVNADNL